METDSDQIDVKKNRKLPALCKKQKENFKNIFSSCLPCSVKKPQKLNST